jgi:hypothetical protein
MPLPIEAVQYVLDQVTTEQLTVVANACDMTVFYIISTVTDLGIGIFHAASGNILYQIFSALVPY